MDDARIAEIRARLACDADTADMTKSLAQVLPKDIRALLERVDGLEGAAKADEQRLIAAAEKAGILYVGCDTPDALAEKVAVAELRESELTIRLAEAERSVGLISSACDKLREAAKAEFAAYTKNLTATTARVAKLEALREAVKALDLKPLYKRKPGDYVQGLRSCDKINTVVEALAALDAKSERIRAAELAVLEAAEISSRAHAVAWDLKGGCCCPLCNAVRNLKAAKEE